MINEIKNDYKDDGATDFMHRLRKNVQGMVTTNSTIIRVRKRVMRIYNIGIPGYNETFLGSSSVNQLLSWLSQQHQMDIKDDIYDEWKLGYGSNPIADNPYLENVRIFRDRSYALTFRTKGIAGQVHDALEHDRTTFERKGYRHQRERVQRSLQRDLHDIAHPQNATDLSLVQELHERFMKFQEEYIPAGHLLDVRGYLVENIPSHAHPLASYNRGFFDADQYRLRLKSLFSDSDRQEYLSYLTKNIRASFQKVPHDSSSIYYLLGINEYVQIVRNLLQRIIAHAKRRPEQ